MDSEDRCLLVFSKPARPGLVKTRLIGELTSDQTAQLHAAFLDDLTARLRQGRFDLFVAWAVAAEESLPASALSAVRQVGESLGDRLYGTLNQVAAAYRWLAAIGSDHPDLALSLVHQAFDKLVGGADVVFGPATDGGYYLVALRSEALHPKIFQGIEWSTSTVLASSLERCRELGLNVGQLPEAADVDTPEDLRRLARVLQDQPELDCPRTRSLLASWGWL